MNTSVSLKVSLSNELRRVSLQTCTYQLLAQTVRSLFKLNGSVDVVIQYKDEEGDMITISSDEETVETVLVHKALGKPFLRLFVSTRQRNTPTPPPAPALAPAPPAPSAKIPRAPQNLHKTVLESSRKNVPESHAKKYLDNCCAVFSEQVIPVSKPSVDLLQNQIKKLKKVETSETPTISHLTGFSEKLSRAQNLLASKIPENVSEARRLFLELQIMDDCQNMTGIHFDLARCASILGNFEESLLYLSKCVSSGGIPSPSLISDHPDFTPLRSLPTFSLLLSSLNSPPGFLQYFLSTLRCVDVTQGRADVMENVKWPQREAEKGARGGATGGEY